MKHHSPKKTIWTEHSAAQPYKDYNFFSWISVNDYRKTRTKIGGEGVKLEGDKTMFGTDIEK